ncbi:MAG TPA: short-chain dehydrogenase/reductase [Solirubrobacteraceae bacterium]|nr:short-chain dehydrogenase/reductase [Solirubrobacteraceae bacterium]
MSRPKQSVYEIAGRTVFITGAARGIGAATAERLYSRGANVALVGLEPERLEALAARLGERALAIEADVTDFGALQRAVAASVERFGGIDVAIANAGVAFTGALASAPMEQIERTFAVNLLGVWRTDRAVAEQLIASGGYLLNISSLSAIFHPPLLGAYATAKSGVDAFSDCLRAELAPSGVQVGCAYFGFLDTDLVRGGYAQPSAQLAQDGTPSFIRNPAPVSKAIDAIERGIERRSPRVWAPRWVGPMIPLRGVLQPLIERRLRSEPERIAQAVELADPESESVAAQDPLLGVAAQAFD